MHYDNEKRRIRHHYAITFGILVSGVMAAVDPSLQTHALYVGLGANLFWIWAD